MRIASLLTDAGLWARGFEPATARSPRREYQRRFDAKMSPAG
jgi:hypothetical protein